MTCRPGAASALLVSCLLSAGCGGLARSGDNLAQVYDDLASRAASAADNGALLGERALPPNPTLFQQVNARAGALVRPYLDGFDSAAAERIIDRGCEVHDAALPLMATLQNPESAVEQAATYAVSQLEQPLEIQAKQLATSLVEAGSRREAAELLAVAAVCA